MPFDLLEEYLTPFSLAVWIMDDGAADGYQLRLNTQSFSLEECTALAGLLLEKFALEFALNLDKGRPRLRCRAVSMPRLRELVTPHLRPEMRYKVQPSGHCSAVTLL